MEISEDYVGWNIQFRHGLLTMLRLDYRAEILIVDDTDKIDFTIETEFSVMSDGERVRCDLKDSSSLAPLLNFIQRKVNTLRIKRSGHVDLICETCGSIEVDPDPSYEAWQLGVSSGMLLVCPPEGKVVVFRG